MGIKKSIFPFTQRTQYDAPWCSGLASRDSFHSFCWSSIWPLSYTESNASFFNICCWHHQLGIIDIILREWRQGWRWGRIPCMLYVLIFHFSFWFHFWFPLLCWKLLTSAVCCGGRGWELGQGGDGVVGDGHCWKWALSAMELGKM